MLFTRPDGTVVRDLSVSRAIQPVMIKSRTGSTVFFDERYDVTETQRFVEAWHAEHPDSTITLFHVFMWATAATLHARPKLNRFVHAGRIWQRKGVQLSFVAKKTKLDDNAALVTIKREFAEGASLGDVAGLLNQEIRRGRTEANRKEDREINFLLRRLPLPLVRLALWFYALANQFNLLPAGVLAHDPLYASLFVANLGSLGMDACYHHLYDQGTCSLFAVLGKVQEENGRVWLPVKYSFDTRVDDGLSAGLSLRQVRERLESPQKFSAAAAA